MVRSCIPHKCWAEKLGGSMRNRKRGENARAKDGRKGVSPHRTHMNTRPGDEAVHGLTGRG